MTMKIAFSTVAAPEWTLAQVCQNAKEFGYEGVELRTFGAGSSLLASDPALSTPARVSKVLKDHGIEPVCLSTSLALHHRSVTQAHQANFDIQRALESAAEIGCPAVRIFGYEAAPGEDRRNVISRIAERAAALTEAASRTGVQLLFENAGSFAIAKEWWWLLDVVNHPMVGLAWNVANSAAVDANDRGGWVSIPMLNSRIRLAKLKDAKLGAGEGYVQLNDGDVGITGVIRRLMGLGYTGYLSVEWDRLWLPSLANATDFLPEAVKRLRATISEIQAAADEARKEKDKAEAKAKADREKALAKARSKAAPASA